MHAPELSSYHLPRIAPKAPAVTPPTDPRLAARQRAEAKAAQNTVRCYRAHFSRCPLFVTGHKNSNNEQFEHQHRRCWSCCNNISAFLCASTTFDSRTAASTDSFSSTTSTATVAACACRSHAFFRSFGTNTHRWHGENGSGRKGNRVQYNVQ